MYVCLNNFIVINALPSWWFDDDDEVHGKTYYTVFYKTETFTLAAFDFTNNHDEKLIIKMISETNIPMSQMIGTFDASTMSLL